MGLLHHLMVARSGQDAHGGALLVGDVGGSALLQGLLHKGIEEGQPRINLQVFAGRVCRQSRLPGRDTSTASQQLSPSAQCTQYVQLGTQSANTGQITLHVFIDHLVNPF